jgi:hypothetical protein
MGKRRTSFSAGALAVCCALCTLLTAAPSGAAQLAPDRPPAGGDVTLPVDSTAQEALRRGDLACLRALERGADAELRWTEAFDAWRAALENSSVGAAVSAGPLLSQASTTDAALSARAAERWPDRDHSFGWRTEAVEVAVLRRLSGLEASERAGWTIRFGEIANERLQAAARSADSATAAAIWARVERLFPATPAAVRAALRRFELDFESGRPRQASAWLERAERHARLAADRLTSSSLARRREALEPWLTRRDAVPPPWSRATELGTVGDHRLVLPDLRKTPAAARIEGQPGLCFLDDGRLAIQTTGTVWLLPTPVSDHEDDNRIFEPWRLAEEQGQPIPRSVQNVGKGWPFFPLASGQDLFLISGRADGVDGYAVVNHSNILQRTRWPLGSEVPTALWSLGDAGLIDETGRRLPLEQVLEAGLWEFQPGPALVEDLLLVQARQWLEVERDGRDEVAAPGEARTWLLALETETGRVRWKRFLGRGSELVDDFGLGLLHRSTQARTPAEALVAIRGSVFVATNLGAGFLLDLCDGRLVWSLRNKRRSASDPGWRTGGRGRARAFSGAAGEGVLWAPADSDELYALSAGLDFAARGELQPPPLVPYPPLAADGGEQLLGGDPRQVLVFARAGARSTLAAHDMTDGRRHDSIYLGSEESWLPGALVCGDRVLFATDGGLYLLDRERELYLTAFHPMRMSSNFAAGGLWARADELYLLARGALFQFQLR